MSNFFKVKMCISFTSLLLILESARSDWLPTSVLDASGRDDLGHRDFLFRCGQQTSSHKRHSYTFSLRKRHVNRLHMGG